MKKSLLLAILAATFATPALPAETWTLATTAKDVRSLPTSAPIGIRCPHIAHGTTPRRQSTTIISIKD